VEKDSFKAAVLKTLISTSANAARPSTSTPTSTSNAGPNTSQTPSQEPRTQPSTSLTSSSNTPTSDQPTMPLRTSTPANPTPASASSANESTASPSAFSSDQSSQRIQNLLSDRRRKLEIDKKEKEAAEKAERKARADARRESMISDPDPAKAKQATYAQQQRKRQHDTKLERERILKQIEHDKTERKEKEIQRKALAKAQSEVKDGAGGLVDQQLSSEISRVARPRSAKECAIQVRLFDGGTIRTRFLSDQTLRIDVRAWVDKERSDGDFPYTFKQILAPLPNRTFSISEEEDSLQSLGLAPSATLVMVPIQGYTAAYIGSQSIWSRGAAAGYNVVSAGAGIVTSAFGTVLGLGQATAQGEEPATGEGRTQPTAPGSDPRGAASGLNIRTLRDQQENREDHQLYNGNQVSLLNRPAFVNRKADLCS